MGRVVIVIGKAFLAGAVGAAWGSSLFFSLALIGWMPLIIVGDVLFQKVGDERMAASGAEPCSAVKLLAWQNVSRRDLPAWYKRLHWGYLALLTSLIMWGFAK